MKKCVLMGCVLGLISCTSLADGFYVAADVGQVDWDIDGASAKKTGWSFAGGYQFSLAFQDTMAVEVGYRTLGVVNDGDDDYRFRTKINAPHISLISTHHFTPQISVYGRVGVARLDVDWKVSEEGEKLDSRSTSVNRGIFGIGGRYSFDEHLAARLEYTYIKWNDFNFSGPGMGVEYNF